MEPVSGFAGKILYKDLAVFQANMWKTNITTKEKPRAFCRREIAIQLKEENKALK
jgi:hypothetical protein